MQTKSLQFAIARRKTKNKKNIMVTTEQIKKLRDKTGISIMQCKKALEEAAGDLEKAVIILSKQSGKIAEKKSSRTLGAGIVQAYIHAGGSTGALVELLCETDFVAKNEEFKNLAYDLAMQVVATDPEFLKKEELKNEDKEKAREVFAKEIADKPNDLKDKILAGKLDAYFKEKILLEQALVKDQNRTVGSLIESATQKFGERIEIGRFVRFSID